MSNKKKETRGGKRPFSGRKKQITKQKLLPFVFESNLSSRLKKW